MNTTAKTNPTRQENQFVRQSATLVDPDEAPGSSVVIFDGECRFCQKQVKNLKRFDSGDRLSFISLHDPRVKQRYPHLTHDQLMSQMYVISPQGNQYGGAAALRFLSRKLPRLWWSAPFLHIPFSLPLWQWFYRRIAIRRYQISERLGEQCEDSCNIHLQK